ERGRAVVVRCRRIGDGVVAVDLDRAVAVLRQERRTHRKGVSVDRVDEGRTPILDVGVVPQHVQQHLRVFGADEAVRLRYRYVVDRIDRDIDGAGGRERAIAGGDDQRIFAVVVRVTLVGEGREYAVHVVDRTADGQRLAGCGHDGAAEEIRV